MSSEPRLAWVVERVAPEATDDVLEIGCGHGIAAALVLARVTLGSYTGLDRSAAMIAAAEARTAGDVGAGRARYVQAAVADAEAALASQRFDRVFAANVRSMSEPRELAIAARLLRPAGVLALAFESPDDGRTRELVTRATRHAWDVGFTDVTEIEGRVGPATVVCVLANAPRGRPQ
jgi:SAM-dependent methyltransferase